MYKTFQTDRIADIERASIDVPDGLADSLSPVSDASEYGTDVALGVLGKRYYQPTEDGALLPVDQV